MYGKVELTPLQKALVLGKLNALLKVMAKGSRASTGELLEAKSNVDELKDIK